EGSEVFARVEDSGVGIPPEELEAIFEEFHQVEGHLTRRYGGLGLGLSIARNLVRLHGGRIWAESEGPGRGARFTIALPAVVPPQEEGKN
ncbi:MAG TPA: ATP-binding protein, partial [Anaerolineaceae bacterium]|nr:ATP-binding protein [Anaerolineaceae bacterium]